MTYTRLLFAHVCLRGYNIVYFYQGFVPELMNPTMGFRANGNERQQEDFTVTI